MKAPAITGPIAATAAFVATGCAIGLQADTFKDQEGKAVAITAIKRASLRIQHAGLEVQVDPVAEYAPETDRSLFPKDEFTLGGL